MAAAVVFGWPTLRGPFVPGDDTRLILGNPAVTHPSAAGAWDLMSQWHSDLYQPLPMLTFQANYALAGARPLSWHAVNLVLHALSATLAGLLAFRLAGCRRVAALTAVLFACHPMAMDAVGWISGRILLMAAAFLLGLLNVFAWRRADAGGGFAIGSILTGVGSLFCKVIPSGPIAAAWVDACAETNAAGDAGRRLTLRGRPRRWWVVVGLLILATLALTWANSSSERSAAFSEAAEAAGTPMAARMLLASRYYFENYVCPTRLTTWAPTPWNVPLFSIHVMIGAAEWAAVIAALAWSWRRNRAIRAGLGLFVIMLAPFLLATGVRNFLTADRYLYLPMAGLHLAMASAAVGLLDRATGAARRPTAIVGALAGLAVVVLWTRQGWLAIGLSALLIVVGALALGPLLLGQVRLGDQELANLAGLGRFLGGLLLAAGVALLWRRAVAPLERPTRGVAVTLAVFGVLALITIRFSYMASFVNYDYTNEYMVYAHGAPATKSIVLEQLEELSMRLHGDLSIKVAYDSDVSWPYTWYLRHYPNKVYFGDNASQSLNDSPVVIVGRKNWENVDPFLANNYIKHDYTFLWWPMEEYRQFSWNALFGYGLPEDQPRRGLGNPDVRQALWDIFWHRDYTKYGEVFGGTYTAGQWPVRHDLRLYIREDVLAELWDHGVGAVSAAGLTDPYEANALALAPALAINETGLAGTTEGTLSSPRNVAVGPDGLAYVADTGNHRIQVYDADGRFLRGWGSFGTEAGQFNEPWGLAVDESYVYVADTWNARIQKFTLAGEFVGAYGVSGSPAADDPSGGLGLFYGPREVVLFGEDQLLVTDTGNHQLQVMDRDGNFLSQVGGFGNQPGQFNEPVGLAVAPDGSVYVADTWNGRIQRLAPDLTPLGEWQVEAWFGQSINNKPYLAVDADGRVYVSDPEGYRVLIFSPSGAYLNRFGQFGTDVASLGLPNGLAIDAAGNLWLADAGNHRVLKYAAIFGVPVAPEEVLPEQPVDDLLSSPTADEPFPTEAAPTEAGPTD